jgi:anti-sigma B factor antagonist
VTDSASPAATSAPTGAPDRLPSFEAMPPEFSLTNEPVDGRDAVAVAVAGEIDLFTAPELKAALTDAVESGQTRIVVDLSATTFLDSTALGVLIGAVKRLRSRDGALTIVNQDATIAKTFEITGLDQIFTIRPTREEALEALDADSATA